MGKKANAPLALLLSVVMIVTGTLTVYGQNKERDPFTMMEDSTQRTLEYSPVQPSQDLGKH